MADLDIRFPVDISKGAIGGPGFSTNIAMTASGLEFRNQNWSLERGEWEVSHLVKKPAKYKPLQAFFRIAAGRANTWRFLDLSDFEVTTSEGVLLPVNGSTTQFQLWKKYTFGAFTYYRKITKPALAVNGVEQTALFKNAVQLTYGAGPTQVEFDESEGLVVFNTAPGGATLTWSGKFDCKCRFDTDQMRAESFEREKGTNLLLINWASIPIVECK